jgi:hypothetical protein
MPTTEALMDSLKNCRKAISQAVPFSKQDDLLQRIQADIIADIRHSPSSPISPQVV